MVESDEESESDEEDEGDKSQAEEDYDGSNIQEINADADEGAGKASVQDIGDTDDIEEAEDQLIIAAMRKPDGTIDYKTLWEGHDLKHCMKWPVLVRLPALASLYSFCSASALFIHSLSVIVILITLSALSVFSASLQS